MQQIQRDFIGLATTYALANGRVTRRVYLDSAASTLLNHSAEQVRREFLEHYANTHSRSHFSARVATDSYALARERVLSFVGADPARYVCIFVGSGATGALNHAAHFLCQHRPVAQTVLVSLMEHHSNDLPHRKNSRVRHVPTLGVAPALGAIDADAFARMLSAEPVRYAAISLVSNVTGIVNPVGHLVSLARDKGVPMLIDASQAIAHIPVRMEELGEPAALVFSGHKVYAPGSPGVLIIRRDVLEGVQPAEFGGGMVEHVSKHDFTLSSELAERAEAGTPNVSGAVLLAAMLEILSRVGMEQVAAHEFKLTAYMLEQLATIPGLRVYGATDAITGPRIGVAAFNIAGLDHGFVAAVLNDYHNIAVRNQCFCAHPFVRAMISPELWELDLSGDPELIEHQADLRRGMVRASLGLYSTQQDIDALIASLRDLCENVTAYLTHYRVDDEGTYRHVSFKPTPDFNIHSAVDRVFPSSTVG